MKKAKFALMSILAVCMALVLSFVPMSTISAETAGSAFVGTQLTSSHAGKTLSGDYYVASGTTLTLRGGTGVSGLKVDANKTLTIHIPADSKLYVYGGSASSTTGAGAGIEVNSGSTLKIIGEGVLYAYGGNGANGSSGAKGDTAVWGDDDYSYIPDSGYGGAGGGGAGAGIGTKGGAGGAQTSWRLGFYGSRNVWTDNFMDYNYSGQDGYKGNAGKSASDCGDIFVYEKITVNATGGSAGAYGGSGGSAGASDYESDDHDMRGMAGGAGGGGGGSGKKGASIGTGGGGGGSGGSGGAIGYAWSCYFLGGGGGGGGAGAKGGSGGAWSADGQIPDHDCGSYTQGKERSSLSGSSGGSTNGGDGGSGCKIKIRSYKGSSSWQWPYGGQGGKGGSAGNDCSEKEVKKLYKVDVTVGEENIGSYYASATQFLPESLTIPTKAGYTFTGFSANGLYYYDENGVRTSEPITAETTISAEFTVNSYNLDIESEEGSTGGGAEVSGPINYGDAITLTTPTRPGYLFRGWKISATNGSINQNAYYTYAPATPMVRSLRATNQISENFVHNNGSAMTAGFEKIGDRITLYNLSVEDNSELKIEEMWVEDNFTVTFKDFNNAVIGVVNGQYGNDLSAPALPNNQNDFYDYRFKYWKCNLNGQYYTTEQLPFVGQFLDSENEYGNAVYHDVTFTAVYEIAEYKKELFLEGFLGNDNLNEDGKLVLNSGDTNIDIVTNFKLTQNDGTASLILIPQYDADAFSIKSISINGSLVWGQGATSTTVLNGFEAIATGSEKESDDVRILLDYTTPSTAVSDDVFVQIVYVMDTAIGGEYEFGFVTNTPADTDSITHGDRSEAYGVYDPDTSSNKEPWEFNELKITVDSTAIKVVIRATGEIIIDDNQSFTYNAEQIEALDVSEIDVEETVKNVLTFNYNGYAKMDENALTIKWYDAEGNELDKAPTNVGTYQVSISALETTYYTPVDPVFATFTIDPYEIYVSANDQSFEYTGEEISINTNAQFGSILTKDADGEYVLADEFVNSEIIITSVQLVDGEFVEVNDYDDVIEGVIQYIGNGDSKNYIVNYIDGTLSITKAGNDWIIGPADKSEEYSGVNVSIDSVEALFGDAEIKYLVDYEKDASGNYVYEDGERIPVWSTTSPVNAGVYPVKVSVADNKNYYGLDADVTLIITKKKINADGFSFEAIDKIYNGEAQYWSLDPNGDDNKDDAEVKIIASNANASVLQYVTFAGMVHPVDCVNVGTHTVQAMLQISNDNYTFVKDAKEVNSVTYDFNVKILKRAIIVNAVDQKTVYDGNEPTVNQGQSYMTITLEDGTTPEFVLRDFFGGSFYVQAPDEFDENAVYYVKDENGNYTRVTLTQDEFDSNNTAEVENYIQYYVLATVSAVENVILSKDTGVEAGEYALIATLEGESNYEIVSYTGIYEIFKRAIALPVFENSEYQNALIKPVLSAEATNVYYVEGEGYINAGTYDVTLSLISDNYLWEVEIDGETVYTSDDQIVEWTIDPKVIKIILPDSTETFVYEDTDGVENWIDSITLDDYTAYTWDPEYTPYADEDLYINIYIADDHHLSAGEHQPSLECNGNDYANYKLRSLGGNFTVTKKVLDADDIAGVIRTKVKYYTGEQLALTEQDFDENMYNRVREQVVNVVEVVNIPNYVDANCVYNSSLEYTGKPVDYYEPKQEYMVTVRIELCDPYNYELVQGADVLDVEAFICKASNAWVEYPEVDASDVTNIITSGSATFGTDSEPTFEFFTDSTCTQPVDKNDIEVGVNYYVRITVEETKNYYGLSTGFGFNSALIRVKIPVVYWGNATVIEGRSYESDYNGLDQIFEPEANSFNDYRYSHNFSSTQWIDADTYTLTFTLNNENNQYEWSNGSTEDVVFTLKINKANLTIEAEDSTINYNKPAPEYDVTYSGLVNGENLQELLGDALYAQMLEVSCGYAQGSNAGDYDICLCNNDETVKNEIVDVLKNYNVTFENGILTVMPLVLDYNDIKSLLGSTVGDLIVEGLTYIYDSESKEVVITNLPDELEAIVVYKDNEGNELGDGKKPTEAGNYTVEIAVQAKEVEDANNYSLPTSPANVTLVIEKALITITIDNLECDYDGNDHSGDITLGTYTIDVNTAQVIEDSVVLTIAEGEYDDVNVYPAVISATHSYNVNNYDVSIVKGDLIIKKVDNSWYATLSVADDIVYDTESVVSGEDFFADPTFGDDDLKYTFYEKIGENWIERSEAPITAGLYAVVASVRATNNYNAITSERVEFTIQKAVITIENVTFNDATVIYNGEEHSIYVINDEASEFFTITYEGNEQVDAGVYPVTATFVLVDTNNYKLEGEETMIATLTIEAVKVTINAQNNSSMYKEEINDLSYTIDFEGASEDEEFYANEFGAVVLSTDATNLSNVGSYDILISYTQNANYNVTANNGIYSIEKFVGNEIDLTVSNVRYLMDLYYYATAYRGQGTITYTFANEIDGVYTREEPQVVGTYYVKASIAETNNYEGAEAIKSFNIDKAQLSAITDITYNGATASWSAVTTTTDNKQINCGVTYLVDGNVINVTTFTATKAENYTVIAKPVDTRNYEDSIEVSLASVWSVTFVDDVTNHDKQQNEAILTDPAFAKQFLFEGEAAVQPALKPEVEGYEFRAWQLNEEDYTFALGVTSDIVLTADWTIKTYVISFYNEVVTGSKVENGVFIEGEVEEELFDTYSITYGSPYNLTGATIPSKPDDEVYSYTFDSWADAIRGNKLSGHIYIYGDTNFYAVYTQTAKQFTITYMVSVDGGAYYEHDTVTLSYGTTLESLDDVKWFKGDTWYLDLARRNPAPSFVPAQNMTLYGAYVFNIGAGDVNADGKVDTNDIFDYRRWFVGGYNIETVEAGTEWTLVNSTDYDANTVYYLVRVSDANRDDSGDIRDITAVRMAIAGGYGYVIEAGNGVTGESVNISFDDIPTIENSDELKDAIEDEVNDVYVKLTSDVTLDEILVLDSGKNVTLHLNGYTLTLANANNYGIAVKNGTLTIEGQGNVIIPGLYGFGTSSVTNAGHIVINGGSYVGQNAYYLFGCYNGSITINGGVFTSDYCVLNNFPDDGHGNVMTGVAIVNGGDFNVTGNDEEYPSYAFLGDVQVRGNATYRVHTSETFEMAMAYGGTVILVDDVVLENAVTVANDKSVVLELNGHTVSHVAECVASYQMIYNKGNLTINDKVGTGKLEFNDTGAGEPDTKWASCTIRNDGVLVVNGGTIEHLGQQTYNSNNAIYSYSGSVTINGGSILAKYSRSVRIWRGSLTINAGEFDGQIWAQLMENCSITINGGTFMPASLGGDSSSIFLTNDNAQVNLAITGGLFLTKVKCSNVNNVVGSITGGIFTESAVNESNAELFDDAYEFVDNGDGTYVLVERQLQ